MKYGKYEYSFVELHHGSFMWLAVSFIIQNLFRRFCSVSLFINHELKGEPDQFRTVRRIAYNSLL